MRNHVEIKDCRVFLYRKEAESPFLSPPGGSTGGGWTYNRWQTPVILSTISLRPRGGQIELKRIVTRPDKSVIVLNIIGQPSQAKRKRSVMKGFVQDIEDLAVKSAEFRRVLYTAKHCQIVLMALKPKEEIGAEVHKLDQPEWQNENPSLHRNVCLRSKTIFARALAAAALLLLVVAGASAQGTLSLKEQLGKDLFLDTNL